MIKYEDIDQDKGINYKIKELLVKKFIYVNQTMLINDLMDTMFDVNCENIEYYVAELISGQFEGNERKKDKLTESLNNKIARFSNALHLLEDYLDNIENKHVLSLILLDKIRDKIQSKCDYLQETIDNLDYDIWCLGDAETCYLEPHEWWLVHPDFAKRLKKHNEVVMNAYNCFWWGRCEMGQHVAMDKPIGDIAYDMEMFEGQDYHDLYKGRV